VQRSAYIYFYVYINITVYWKIIIFTCNFSESTRFLSWSSWCRRNIIVDHIKVTETCSDFREASPWWPSINESRQRWQCCFNFVHLLLSSSISPTVVAVWLLPLSKVVRAIPVACHYAVIYKVHTSVAEDICIYLSIKPVILFFSLALFPMFSRSSMSIYPRVSSFPSKNNRRRRIALCSERNDRGVTRYL